MKTSKSKFECKKWDEESLFNTDKGAEIKRAVVENAYSGDMKGVGKLEYLLSYQNSEEANYIGYELFKGTLNGKKGSFIMKHEGIHRDNVANTKTTIIPGTGSEELEGIEGEGSFKAESRVVDFDLQYKVD